MLRLVTFVKLIEMKEDLHSYTTHHEYSKNFRLWQHTSGDPVHGSEKCKGVEMEIGWILAEDQWSSSAKTSIVERPFSRCGSIDYANNYLVH